jgi:transcriptional regulator with XRE-family HTH domain
MTQKQLAELANMAQPRISAMEQPGETAFNIETLVRLASALKVGLKVEFVEFSEMLAWENSYSQDEFDVVPLDKDTEFLHPQPTVPQAMVLKSYQWRDVGQVVWQEHLGTCLCVGHHGGGTFPVQDFVIANYKKPQEAVSEMVPEEIGTTAFPFIQSESTLEGVFTNAGNTITT